MFKYNDFVSHFLGKKEFCILKSLKKNKKKFFKKFGNNWDRVITVGIKKNKWLHCFAVILIGHGEFLSMGDKGKGGIDSVCKIKKRLGWLTRC